MSITGFEENASAILESVEPSIPLLLSYLVRSCFGEMLLLFLLPRFDYWRVSKGAAFGLSLVYFLLFFNCVAHTAMERVLKNRAGSPGLGRSRLVTKEGDPIVEDSTSRREERGGSGGGGGAGGSDAIRWVSSALVFAFWAGLLLYAFTVAPNHSQKGDLYVVGKLLGLHSDDGFAMNKVSVAEFYMMGLWPLVYTSLLIPTGRSQNGLMVGPFAVVSFALGSFALLPYFGLWRPPPPLVPKIELRRFPLNVLESKITAMAAIVGGIAVTGYAGLAGGDQWTEFFQYTRESRFIHIMSIDFMILAILAPFWVYNDLSVRQGSNKVSWVLPLSIIPYFGPASYLLLRPALPSAVISGKSEEIDDLATSQ